jgi:haloacetate dehalogenase
VVTRLALLDIVPTRHALHNVDRAAAAANYHWFFLAAGGGVPEHMIAADADFWVRSLVGRLLGAGTSLRPEVMGEYVRCFRDPATIAGSCADFRSGLSVDLDHDDETFDAGAMIDCPLLVLWGKQGMAGGPDYSPLRSWQQYAGNVRGSALPTGHFIQEEAPEQVVTALRGFLA